MTSSWTFFRTSTDKLRTDLGWDTLETRRKMHKIHFLHNILHNPNVPPFIRSLIPTNRANNTNINLRRSDRLTQIPHNTICFKNTFLVGTLDIWNQLPQNIHNSPSSKTFKSEISKILSVSPPPLYYSLGSKKENYLLTRLRVGMSQLNSHQFTIHAASSPNCVCGGTRECTAHYFLNCPKYNNKRLSLIEDLTQITNKNVSSWNASEKLNLILHGKNLDTTGSRQVARCVFKYIKDTKRF